MRPVFENFDFKVFEKRSKSFLSGKKRVFRINTRDVKSLYAATLYVKIVKNALFTIATPPERQNFGAFFTKNGTVEFFLHKFEHSQSRALSNGMLGICVVSLVQKILASKFFLPKLHMDYTT